MCLSYRKSGAPHVDTIQRQGLQQGAARKGSDKGLCCKYLVLRSILIVIDGQICQISDLRNTHAGKLAMSPAAPYLQKQY
jgi:hypothetical protein